MTNTYQCADGSDFPVEWEDPGDAQSSWRWNDEHWPNPLTPLSTDFITRTFLQPGSIEFRAEMSEAVVSAFGPKQMLFPNGFAYGRIPAPSASGSTESAEVANRQRESFELAPRVREVWEREQIPVIRATCLETQRGDFSTMLPKELAARLEELIDACAYAYSLTFASARPMFRCVEPLVEFCKQEYGDSGETIAAQMIEGFANESSNADMGVWRLAQLVATSPGLAMALDTSATHAMLDALGRGAGGREFLAHLYSYLDLYGWRIDAWDELSATTWHDDPGPALQLIRRFITGENRDPNKAMAASAARRRRAIARARSKLNGDRRRHFDSLLTMAQQYVPVRESRALWQLTLGGSIRVPCVALGRKLQEKGTLERAEDIFYLRLEDVKLATKEPASDDWSTKVADRKRERAFWMNKAPPALIGKPVEEASEGTAHLPEHAPGDDQRLRGLAASRGRVRATAKVVRTLDDAGKVEDGEVLVCRMTSPRWSPLFGRVAAVVAETGGVLAHCAIVAREYGIPCVVAVPGCTDLIRDGSMVTVDGTDGTVLVEGAG